MNEITITTEFIKLDAFLKFAGICSTGGEAKIRIEQGDVLVDGAPCFQRGRKLREGARVQIDGQTYAVISA